jgi:hypothetical protein
MTISSNRSPGRRLRRATGIALLTTAWSLLTASGAAAQDPTASLSPGATEPAASPTTPATPAPTPAPTPVDAERVFAVIEGLERIYEPLEADRLLLIELRKELPEARSEAEEYLARTQQLALIANPARLGPSISRVLASAPIYLDWRDGTYATPEEASLAYQETGAAGFDRTWSDFRNDVLLSVSNQLDAVLSAVDRIRR